MTEVSDTVATESSSGELIEAEAALNSHEADSLADRIQAGDASAWEECIARYEGRLLAYVRCRVHDTAASEDIVQETFLGFLTSLPNYDPATPIETFLFAIAAHKLTDWLRRHGRRPTFPLAIPDDEGRSEDPPGRARVASSLARSRERRGQEARIIHRALRELVTGWQQSGQFERLKCMELLWVSGLRNRDVAAQLGLSEQDVANHKQTVVRQLKAAATQQMADIELSEFGIE